MKRKVFLFWNGLNKLAEELQGDENIFVGTRPFGFHGGNRWTMIAYPWHLFRKLEENGKKPKFTFYISINDMEPCHLKYLYLDNNSKPYYKTLQQMGEDEEPPYNYNVFPEDTSFQFTADPDGCCDCIAGHWQKIMEKEMSVLKKEFPQVRLRFVRNSEIKNKEIFLEVLKKTLEKPALISQAIKRFDDAPILDKNLFFAGAICPECDSAQGKTSLADDIVEFSCNNCSTSFTGNLRETNFWMHHVPLLIPRILLFDIDVCIRGGDHYQAKRVEINNILMEELGGSNKNPSTLVAPMVMSYNGRKMSKSWFNERDISLEKVLAVAKEWNKASVPLEKFE